MATYSSRSARTTSASASSRSWSASSTSRVERAPSRASSATPSAAMRAASTCSRRATIEARATTSCAQASPTSWVTARRGVLQLEAALVEQRLRLAHQAVVAAAGVERHRPLDADLAEGVAVPAAELVVAALDAGAGGDRDLRPLGGEGPVEVVDRDALAELGGDDRSGCAGPRWRSPRRRSSAPAAAAAAARGCRPGRRRRRGRPRGRSRAAPCAPARVEREAARRDSALADVGAGHLADVEAVAGRAQGLVEALDVVAGEAHELLVAAHVDVGLHRVEEHLLLDVLEVGAAGGDLVARRLDRRLGLRRCRR